MGHGRDAPMVASADGPRISIRGEAITSVRERPDPVDPGWWLSAECLVPYYLGIE
jgi:hypothetical protein